MANKKIKLKNANGDYLLPYTTNVPDATSETKGLVEIEDTPTTDSTKVLTSGGAKNALAAKLDVSGTAAKATADASGNVITTTYATKTELQTAQETANEAKSLAEGRSRATAYSNYETLITELNSAASNTFKIGDNLLIQAQNVPDLWVYAIESTTAEYTYTTDDAFVSAIQSTGFVQVGYYKLAALESAKIDLTGFVPTTRTINGKALSTDITLSAADIADLDNSYLGKDATAAKAVADADGNNISTTYLKVSDAISFEEME